MRLGARPDEVVTAPCPRRRAVGHDQTSGGQIRLGQVIGQQGHPQPVQGGLRDGRELVIKRALRQIGRDPVMGEPVGPGPGPRLDMQQRQGQQVTRLTQRAAHRKLGGADSHDGLRAQQHMICAGPVRIAIMDRRIKGLRGKVERRQPGRHVDRHIRMQPREIRQARHQPAHPECRQDRQIQRAPARLHPQPERGLRDLVQRLAHLGHIGAGRRREVHPPPLTQNQRDTHLRLERLDLPADRTLGQGQLLGHRRGAAQTVQSLQRAQRGDGRQKAAWSDHLCEILMNGCETIVSTLQGYGVSWPQTR